MKKLLNSNLVLATIFAISTSLHAETVNLSEVDGDCPSTEIDYLSNLTTYTSMEGIGTIQPGWDGDKYSFTPATDGVLKVHLNAADQELSMKIDTVCDGSGLLRSIKKADHGEQEFTITADQTIEIALWDWESGAGYTFNLDVEFTPDGTTSEVPSKVSISQSSTSVGEGGTHTYTLNLDKPSSIDTVVTVVIGHITTDDSDVIATTRDITILATESSKIFTIDTIDDAIEESSESFSVSISQTDNTTVIVDNTSNSISTTIADDDTTTGGNNEIVIYEDAQNANTAGWTNISSESGSVTNIVDTQGNRVIKLTGSTTDNLRAAYTFKNDDGTLWNSTQNFIAKWDMKASDDYEIFFIAKSSDDVAIDNYIGYVNSLPTLEGYTFDSSSGYWSDGDTIYRSWGRYTYIVLGDTSNELTTITKDLYADANQELGVILTSIESMHVNVYGGSGATLLLDNISLQRELTVPNNAPIAQDKNVSLNENSTLDITLIATDGDNDTLTYSIVDIPSNGSVTIAGAVVTYTPNADYNGTDSFTFKANDTTVDSNIATVNIIINNIVINTPPIAQDQSVSVDGNATINITLTATDSENDSLNFTIVSQPTKGSLTGDVPNLVYTPTVNEDANDSFTFKVNDGTVDSPTVTVSITITAVTTPNTPPVANDQNVSMNENRFKDITLTAIDSDDDNLTYIIVTNPSNGTVDLVGAVVTYTPNADYNGTDSFTFKASDATDDSNIATVNIVINDIPVVNEDKTTYEDAEDGNTTGWVVYDNDPVDANISNVFDSDKNSTVIEFSGDRVNNGYRLGNYSNRAGDWNNTSQFNINWSMKYSERYAVYIRVETTEGWRFLYYTNIDSDLGIRDVRYIHHGLGSDTTDGTWKSFTRNLQADLNEFEPDNNITSVNAFLIRGSGRVDDISLFSTPIVPQNIAPVAQDQNVSMNENDTFEITLVAIDENNDTLTYSIVDNPSNGNVTIEGAVVTYTPNTDYNGTDSFTFVANDSNASSQTATINIVINNVLNIVSITEDENLSEHFLGMPIEIVGDKTVINGTITSNWDVDRYSFNADSLGEVTITLKDSSGVDMPFYVLKNYTEIVTQSSIGIYDLGSDFSVITIMIVAESSEGIGKDYILTIE